jgi:hypothetical protein
MEPAYPIVLTSEQHALLGEIVEIMGQTDNILLGTVARLLNVDKSAAREIMGSTRIENNVSIWGRVVRDRFSSPEVSSLVLVAATQISDLARRRNDFIHALYTNDYADGYVQPGYQTTTATRIRSGRSRPTSDLQSTRELAATVSCLVAHVDHQATTSEDRGPSPWLERLGSLLQAHPRPRRAPRRGKERQPPP